MELQTSWHLQPVTAEMQAKKFQAPIEEADNFWAPIEGVKYTNFYNFKLTIRIEIISYYKEVMT